MWHHEHHSPPTIDQHAAAGGARDPQRDVEILRGVARRVEIERQLDRFVGGECRQRQAGEQQNPGSGGGTAQAGHVGRAVGADGPAILLDIEDERRHRERGADDASQSQPSTKYV